MRCFYDHSHVRKVLVILYQAGDKVYKLNMDMPWSAVLNFDSVRRGFERMFAMFNPLLQLPLLAVGYHTFPHFGPYKRGGGSEEKVPMPLSMYWAYEKLLNSPKFQRRTGLTWRMVEDEDDPDHSIFLMVNRKFVDLYHTFNPFVLSFDENIKFERSSS